MYIFTFLQFYLVFTDVDVIVEEIDKSSGISKQQTLIKCEIYSDGFGCHPLRFGSGSGVGPRVPFGF